jgi:hypothetical protein
MTGHITGTCEDRLAARQELLVLGDPWRCSTLFHGLNRHSCTDPRLEFIIIPNNHPSKAEVNHANII